MRPESDINIPIIGIGLYIILYIRLGIMLDIDIHNVINITYINMHTFLCRTPKKPTLSSSATHMVAT